MKKGYKHKTGVFGTDSEHYASQLFLMMRNSQGSRRPDLISVGGKFDPMLSIELKSGRNFKGVMGDYQLHYALTTDQDYEGLFGGGDTEGEDDFFFQSQKVAYYYNVINRVDELTSNDLDKPYSAIKIRWGDQFMVPGEYGFYSFAINMSRRTGDPVEEVVDYLREMMQEDVLGNVSDYWGRKKNKQSYQDLHGRDIHAIHQNDLSIATVQGRERIEAMHEHYSDLSKLKRISIPGPNGTTIYILANPEDVDLMNKQFRSVVEERTPLLERIVKEREEAVPLLDKIQMSSWGLYENGNLPDMEVARINLPDEEIVRLRGLTKWMTKTELEEEELVPF